MQYTLSLPTLFTILALGFMSLVVIRSDRKLANVLFVIFVVVDVLWLSSVWVVNSTDWGLSVFWSRLVFALPIALAMALHAFTGALLDIRHSVIYKFVIFYGGGLTLLLTLFTTFVISSVQITVDTQEGSSPFPEYGILAPVFIIYLLTNLTLLFIMLARHGLKLKRIKTVTQERQRLRAVVVGLIALVAISLLTNLILPTIVSHAWPSQFAPLGSLVLVFAFFYAIMRYKLFDIRPAVIRSTSYVVLAVVLILLFIGIINVGGAFVRQFSESQVTQDVFYAIIALGLAVFFYPLRRLFDKITNRIFFRDMYDPQVFIDNLNQVLVKNIEVDQLLTDASNVIGTTIKTEYCYFGVNGSGKKGWQIFGPTPKGFTEEAIHSIHRKIASIETVVVSQRLPPTQHHLAKVLQNQGVGVVVRIGPLSSVQSSTAYLVLGQKKSGNMYSQQDIQILSILSKSLLIAIQNALSVQEVKEINDTLQQRIDDATKELRKTNEQLQKLDTAKDEFVSMASHQLRTPLTSVKGYISMVLEGDVGKITPMQRQLLGEAFTSSERMVHLIGDFLNVSRLQTGKFLLEKRPIDLSKLVSQEIDSLHSTAEAHGLKLEYRKPSHFPILMLDEGKVRQVLMNFIDNAIFYSQEGETITVKLELEAGYAVLRVIDEGIGVPKSEQAHLFAKFYRASNARKQRPDGTGVGLFLAKKVVVAHGGTIVFETKEGEGSTFGFRLPVKKLQASKEEVHTSAGNRANKLNK